jgi:predicted rRNA methylase YqxC with S4 and FtsJ domains
MSAGTSCGGLDIQLGTATGTADIGASTGGFTDCLLQRQRR